MTGRGYQSKFRPVLEAAIRYRDADTDREWRAARTALAVAIVRWWEGLAPTVAIEVLNLPDRAACERWRAVADAAIEYAIPEGARTLSGWQPERRNSCAAWHRLHHAAQRWAVVAVVKFPAAAEGVSHAA